MVNFNLAWHVGLIINITLAFLTLLFCSNESLVIVHVFLLTL